MFNIIITRRGKRAVPGPANSVTLTFSSVFDTNGAVYYIGTDYLTTSFTNPHTSGKVVVTRSSVNTGTVTDMCSRAYEDSWTQNLGTGGWNAIDLGAGRSLKVNYYVLCGVLTNGGTFPRSWKLQGSNDGTNWTDLDTQTNNTSIAAAQQSASVAVSGQTIYYRYLRTLLSNSGSSQGDNLLLSSDFEFYGVLSY